MLGVDDQGNPNAGTPATDELHDHPGFADTWFDLKTGTVSSS